MPLSRKNFFGLVDDSNPQGTDSRVISDDQHREILSSLKEQCPNWTGAVTATQDDVNGVSGFTAAGVQPMPGQGGVTVLFAYNTDTPPLGWTVEEPDTNLRELIIGPAAGGGATGGTMDPTNMVDNAVTITFPAATQGHGLTAAENAPHVHTGTTNVNGNHTHPVSIDDGTGVGSDRFDRIGPSSTRNTSAAGDHTHTFTTNSQGSGTPHTHDIGGTTDGTATMTPRYARGILMKLAV